MVGALLAVGIRWVVSVEAPAAGILSFLSRTKRVRNPASGRVRK